MFVNEVNCSSNYWENSVLMDDYHQSSDPCFDESAMSSSPTAARATLINNTNFPSSLVSTERAPPAATFSCFSTIEMPTPKLYIIDGDHNNNNNNILSRSDDSRENSSSLSQQISDHHTNSRKRKYYSIPINGKGKQQHSAAPTPATAKHPTPTNNISAAAAGAEKSESISAKKSNSEDDKDGANRKQSKDSNNNNSKEESPKDYIHVRARRGQATDAHSLAERVRREKISEKMKVLQDLVPGCNKVTGKAVMLDEIINYVESLQRQVEFLSMKLATVNSRMDFNMEALMSNSKDMFLRGSNIYPSDSSCCAYPFLSQPNTAINIPPPPTGTHHEEEAPNSFSPSFRTNHGMDNHFRDSASQVSTFWEDDLHSVVQQMGFGQNQTQVVHGS